MASMQSGVNLVRSDGLRIPNCDSSPKLMTLASIFYTAQWCLKAAWLCNGLSAPRCIHTPQTMVAFNRPQTALILSLIPVRAAFLLLRTSISLTVSYASLFQPSMFPITFSITNDKMRWSRMTFLEIGPSKDVSRSYLN